MFARHWLQQITVACGAMFVLVCAALAAPEFPQLSGRVVDTAGLLDASTKASLTDRLTPFSATWTLVSR